VKKKVAIVNGELKAEDNFIHPSYCCYCSVEAMFNMISGTETEIFASLSPLLGVVYV